MSNSSSSSSASANEGLPSFAEVKSCPMWLRGFAWFVVLSTFFLIGVGGHVTSTDSGDAVPTWPLPLTAEMEGGVLFELGHRQVAGFVGIITGLLFLTIMAARSFGIQLHPKARRLATISFILVIVQAGLGGARVLLAEHLDDPESLGVTAFAVVHTLLGQTFLCFTLAVAFYLRPSLNSPLPTEISSGTSNEEEAPDLLTSLKDISRSANLAMGFIFIQLFLGAILRLTRPGPVPLLLLLHILGALLATHGVFAVLFRALRYRPVSQFIQRPAFFAAGLIGVQLIIGFVAYFAVAALEGGNAEAEITWKTVIPTLHLTVGTLILVTIFWIHLAAKTRLRSLES